MPQAIGFSQAPAESNYGRWRGLVDQVVYAFADCGVLRQGFARVYCDACRSEYLLAFSCTRRGLCPSCAAKRGAIFGVFLREEVLEEVGHCLWTFTIPKLLRPFYLHRRQLLGSLCRAAWETVAELVAEAEGEGVRPGMVAALHTAASDLRWHPHVHALASRGGWDREGLWHPVLCQNSAGEIRPVVAGPALKDRPQIPTNFYALPSPDGETTSAKPALLMFIKEQPYFEDDWITEFVDLQLDASRACLQPGGVFQAACR